MSLIGITLFTGVCTAQALTIEPHLNEQVVMITASARQVVAQASVQLETTIFKPPGDGPFPVMIMNHGKAIGNPHGQKRERFIVISREFIKRGYAVVIPMRKGFSKSSGDYQDGLCDMTANGQSQADDLQTTIDYLRTQPWADANRVVVGGQSHGGLTAMAFGTRNVPGVRGLINFAGGLRVHGGDCRWRSSLVDAFASYGSKTATPSIWFYGENDSHFDPIIAARMFQAYIGSGGVARMIAYGAFKKDAHSLSGSRDGVKVWWPETEKFLKEIGLPTDEVIAIADDLKFARTDFATLTNVTAIPYLEDSGREQYRVFLGKPLPRAFAVSSSGAWSWAEDGDDPASYVLEHCQAKSSQPCKLYAVDNDVVWVEKAPLTASNSR
ncbi:MAG: prolyl oligopeptidase family serine peptidase [Herminiimonas sp.]|nr:prolyl oligopeptidase family serine peptidase [Herminiimonas sp.]